MYSPATDPNIQTLLDQIVPTINPQAVYLLGSRTRGEAHEWSDYDLFMIADDNANREKLQIPALSRLEAGTGIMADFIPCHRKIYEEYQDELGSISCVVQPEGRQIYARAEA